MALRGLACSTHESRFCKEKSSDTPKYRPLAMILAFIVFLMDSEENIRLIFFAKSSSKCSQCGAAAWEDGAA